MPQTSPQSTYPLHSETTSKALRDQLARLDPVVEEPTLRVLTPLACAQERHVAELPVDRRRPASSVAPGPQSAARSEAEPGAGSGWLAVGPPIERPARDPFVTVTGVTSAAGDAGAEMHARVHLALCGAELAARASHEHPALPWAFHAAMARRVADEARHAVILDRLMTTELGRHWGDHAVGLDDFAAISARELSDRLPLLGAAVRPGPLPDAGEHPAISQALAFVEAERAAHLRAAVDWSERVRVSAWA